MANIVAVLAALCVVTLVMVGLRQMTVTDMLRGSISASSTNTADTDNDNDAFCALLKSGSRAGPLSTHRSVHVVIANNGTLPLLKNMLCSMSRLQLFSMVVLAMDDYTCPALALVTPAPDWAVICTSYTSRYFSLLNQHEPLAYAQQLDVGMTEQPLHHSASWGQTTHKTLINAKLYAALDTLKCGLGAFVTDVDIVFMQDPFPVFRQILSANRSLEMLFQDDTNYLAYQLSLNTGFFYLVPSQGNVNFMKSVITLPVFWHIDQARINELLSLNKYAHPASWHRLDQARFPNGFVLRVMAKNGGVRRAPPPASNQVVPTYAHSSNATKSNAFDLSSSVQGHEGKENVPIPTSSPSPSDPAAVVAAHANWTADLQAKIDLLKEAKVWCLEWVSE